MQDLHRNLIGGEWRDGADFTANVSPSDNADIVGHYAAASASDVLDAIEAARLATHGWARSPIQRRRDILRAASVELSARREELGRLLAREEGKVLAEAVAEVERAANVFDFFAGETLRLGGEAIDSVRPGVNVDISRESVGVVGIITPWNYPIAIPAWKIAPALAYGNTIVFKPADLVPASAWALVDILHRAGLPPGVLNLVMGKGAIVGQAIVDSPLINAISFTGSTATGRRIAETSARHLRKVQLEMGGKNPLVVLDDADLDIAVDCAVNGGFFSTGQRCTASSRFIVQNGIHDRFVAAVSERMEKLVVDNALLPEAQIGPVVSAGQLQQNLDYVSLGQAEGAALAAGGQRIERATAGFYQRPALFVGARNDMRICREEIFGPVAGVIRVADYEEALAVANDTEFGLSSGICTTSLKYASHFRRNSEAGMVMVNLPTAGVDYHVPFGGRKASSFGPREQGRHAAEFYTVTKTSYVRPD
ncbi:MAG: aldehyde dehydrogenase [Pelagibacterium sp. SCN 64-44]|nr:MAG: aldehyde dehydrogenase [Pelagibacterium sp. SCN 64-44]